MKERVGNIRKIDKLGRVSIPVELSNKYPRS